MSKASEKAEARRRFRRRVFWLAALAAVVLAVMFIRCGGGFGFGRGKGLGNGKGLGLSSGSGKGSGSGSGTGSGTGPAAALDAGVRCQIRVDAAGISVDGKPAPVADVVTACKTAGGAEVVVTGDAREGTWDELHAALDAAQVPTAVRGAGGAP